MATYGAHSPMVLLFVLQNKDAIRRLAEMALTGERDSYRFANLKQDLVDAKMRFFGSGASFPGFGGLVSNLIREEEEKLNDKDVLGSG